jgi:hypothetical protein
MPKVTKQSEGRGDAMVNTETGEETEMAEDPLRPIFSPLGVAELSGKKCEYRKVRGTTPLRALIDLFSHSIISKSPFFPRHPL